MRRALILGMMLLFVATANAENAPPTDSDRAEILAVLEASVAGWNAGEISTYMASYWRSPELRFASGGTVSLGWQPVLKRYLSRYPDQETMGHLIFSDLEVQLTGPDHAVAFGRWRLERADDEPRGLFTLVLRRFDHGWRIVHDHTSSARE